MACGIFFYATLHRHIDRNIVCHMFTCGSGVNVIMPYSKERSSRDGLRGERQHHRNGYTALTGAPVAMEMIQRLLTLFQRVHRNLHIILPISLMPLWWRKKHQLNLMLYSHMHVAHYTYSMYKLNYKNEYEPLD